MVLQEKSTSEKLPIDFGKSKMIIFEIKIFRPLFGCFHRFCEQARDEPAFVRQWVNDVELLQQLQDISVYVCRIIRGFPDV